MPRPSAWAVRASLIHLSLGFTLGALLLTNKGLAFAPDLWRLLPAHIEILLVGWVVQLALGVAYWILPRVRASRGAEPEAPGSRGGQIRMIATLVLLNGGVLLAGFGPVVAAPAEVRLAGRIAEAAAALLFALHAARRLRP
jgi:hypothetical protein